MGGLEALSIGSLVYWCRAYSCLLWVGMVVSRDEMSEVVGLDFGVVGFDGGGGRGIAVGNGGRGESLCARGDGWDICGTCGCFIGRRERIMIYTPLVRVLDLGMESCDEVFLRMMGVLLLFVVCFVCVM